MNEKLPLQDYIEDAEKDAEMLRHIYSSILLHPTSDYLINCFIKAYFQDTFKRC